MFKLVININLLIIKYILLHCNLYNFINNKFSIHFVMDPYALGKNLRTPGLHALKQANVQWSECVAKNFMPQWLAGNSITLNDVC